MKRSEMLSLLEDYLLELLVDGKLAEEVEIHGYKDILLIGAPEKLILDFIERQGMLPPPQLIKDEYGTVHRHHVWEPEDEA